MRSILIFVLLASPVAAQEAFELRSDDQTFEQADLDALVRGEVFTFYDDGAAEFYEDGRYTYTYANDGGTGYGYFEVGNQSDICIEFVNGFSRCDAYVTDAAGRLVVVTQAGDRFPIRP